LSGAELVVGYVLIDPIRDTLTMARQGHIAPIVLIALAMAISKRWLRWEFSPLVI